MTTSIDLSPTAPAGRAYGPPSVRAGAAAGVLAIALIVAGFALIAPAGATITSSAEEITAFYTGSDVTRVVAGGVLECLGFVLLLAFAAALTGLLRGPGVTGELLPAAGRLAATAYVTICLAPGMAAGGAALWLAHSGAADPTVLLALNTLRGFSYFAGLLCFAAFLLCVGTSATVSGRLPRWAAWSAIGIGAALVGTVPVATSELPDMFALTGLAWVLAVGVHLVRRPAGVPGRA